MNIDHSPVEDVEDEALNQEDDHLDLSSAEDDRKIIWQAKDWSIREFKTMEEDGDLVLQPDYQRNYVMDATKASRLIESIMMEVPIPVVYLAEEPDGTYSVIDGQQRLTSFISFMKGYFPDGKSFELRGLKVLDHLNRKTFSDLERLQQSKIKTTTIHTIIIKRESEEDIKFEIFERLNTGSIKLNEDELRNSVYRGGYIKLLAELEDHPLLDLLIDKDNYKKRMRYRGMLLRYFALADKTYLNYKPSMKQFLNKELRDNRNITPEKAQEYRDRLDHLLELVRTVFGKEAFRKYTLFETGDVNGQWSKGVNTALFEVQMCGFNRYQKHEIVPRADEIRNAMIELLIDPSYNETISIRTNDRSQLTERHRRWFDRLEEIVGKRQRQARTFPISVKKELYNQSTACAICGQEIQMLDDAEVDHITPFSKGGYTMVDNAQLTHRYCNRAKNNRE